MIKHIINTFVAIAACLGLAAFILVLVKKQNCQTKEPLTTSSYKQYDQWAFTTPLYGFNILIEATPFKNFSLYVEPTDTIKNVKTKIYKKEGHPIANQNLEFGDTKLKDDRTISSYNITNNSHLFLFLMSPE